MLLRGGALRERGGRQPGLLLLLIELCNHVLDLLLVVGASNSSNSNRLRDVGVELGKPSYLVEDADSLDPCWLDGVSSVGVTAGASAPEELVQGLIQRLADFGEVELLELAGVDESITFKLPPELADAAAEARA